jgi:hypothetical protein
MDIAAGPWRLTCIHEEICVIIFLSDVRFFAAFDYAPHSTNFAFLENDKTPRQSPESSDRQFVPRRTAHVKINWLVQDNHLSIDPFLILLSCLLADIASVSMLR